jgi:predicted RND superfamily exporter protein
METGFRDQIERGFESWGRIVAARPVTILIASLLFAAACISGVPRLRVDVSFESFLQSDDPVRVAYDSFREQFGRDERVIISAEPGPQSGPYGVFDRAFLEKLRAFHEALEERTPYVDDITSLVNARDTRGEEDTLLVEDFLDPWPEDGERLAVLRKRALANPLFLNNVISADAAVTTLVLELQLYSSIGIDDEALAGFDEEAVESDELPALLSGAEEAEFAHALHEIIAEFEGPDFILHMAGSTIMLQDISAAMFHDMPRFVGLAIASIALLLFALFRRLVAVVIPLVLVILSVASTFGLMGWSGTSVHVPTQILPSFLVAVGVGDSVHLLAIFFERIRRGEDRADALAHALGHSGLALVLTSVTTAAGLASFAGAGIAPVAALGVFAPIGVMIALVLSLTLLPALIQLVPLGNPRGHATSEEENVLDRILVGLGRFATRRPLLIVGVSAVMILLAVVAASRITLSHDPLGWLADDTKIVQGTKYIDQVLKGSVSFEILLETDEAGGIRQPRTLERMAELGQSFEHTRRDDLVAAQTMSLADVVKEINRALNGDREEAYAIPNDPQLVSQELLLFENTGTDDLEELVDTEFRIARIAVRMPWRDAVRYTKFFDSAEADATAALEGVGTPSITGVLALLVRAITAVVTSMAQSYLLAFAIITPIMILLLGNLRMGLLAMVPNLAPIILTLGLMGIFELPLDAFSLLVGGIAIGLAVDDTIHFMHNYRRYRDKGADLETAVETTLLTAGRAMLITTVVLSTGFFGFVLSSMHNLTNLGILVSFAVTTAFFADVLLAPALLALFDRDTKES